MLDLDLFGFSEAWTAAKNDAAALGAGKPHYCGVIGFHNAKQTVRQFKKLKIPLRVKIVATERRASADSELGIFDGTDFNLNFDIIKCVERDDTDGVYCPCNFH